ncbi:MAG: hypothetical protein HC763_28045, partial [Hydrococcus sp. CRU_1_1]|nr:hypothetical protein [Hydrococcus sp. CRU_1_1]
MPVAAPGIKRPPPGAANNIQRFRPPPKPRPMKPTGGGAGASRLLRRPPLPKPKFPIPGGLGPLVLLDLFLDQPGFSDGTIPPWLQKNNPGQPIQIDPPIPPPFTGGQDPNAFYNFRVRFKPDPPRNWVEQMPGQYTNVRGPISRLNLKLDSGINVSYNREGFPSVEGTARSGRFTLEVWAGNGIFRFNFGYTGIYQLTQAEFLEIIRKDNQPDTGGNPPPIQAAAFGFSPPTAPPANPSAPPNVPPQIKPPPRPGTPQIKPFKRPPKRSAPPAKPAPTPPPPKPNQPFIQPPQTGAAIAAAA